MAIHFFTKGKPVTIREVKYEDEYLFCIDFEEESKAAPPKDLPKPEMVSTTAILNTKQFNKLEKIIKEHGDTLETAHQLFIKGEIINDLPYEVCSGDIAYICFEAQYFPRKEGVEFDGNKTTISLLRENRGKSPNSTKKEAQVSEEIQKLHKQFDGVCQSCGQRCDKKVMSIPEGQADSIVCPDCYHHYKKDTVTIEDEILKKFVKHTSMETEAARDYLLNYPLQFALTTHNIKDPVFTRKYWGWEESSPIRHLWTGIDGAITSILFKDGMKINNYKSILRKKKPEYILIKDQKYEVIKNDEMSLTDISIPDSFLSTTPNPNKIKNKIEYYKLNHSFQKSLVVIQNNNKNIIMDGYTMYLAAKKLDLKKVSVQIVKKSQTKGRNKDAIKN